MMRPFLVFIVSLYCIGCGNSKDAQPAGNAAKTSEETPLLATEQPKITPPSDANASEAPRPSADQAGSDPIQAAWSERAIEQKAELVKSKLMHDFQYTDHYDESGITFEHGAVDDAGKYYKSVHYDHGNGVAVADVDGDDLLDVYLTNQIGSNGLYRNQGDATFSDLTANGLDLKDRVSVAAAFADIDNDGDPDLFVTTVKMGNVLFENLGGGRFQEITEQAGLGYVGHSSGGRFF